MAELGRARAGWLGSILLGVALSLPSLALAVDGPARRSIHDSVPRQVRVSVGRDHVWASIRSRLRPSVLGLPDWSTWDVDGSGDLVEAERRKLLVDLKAHEVEYLALQVDGEVMRVPEFRVKWLSPPPEHMPLDQAFDLRIEGRMKLPLAPGAHSFVLSDRPRDVDGVVPFRFSVVKGMEIVTAAGARAELRGPTRLEAVITRDTKAVWGSFVVEP